MFEVPIDHLEVTDRADEYNPALLAALAAVAARDGGGPRRRPSRGPGYASGHASRPLHDRADLCVGALLTFAPAAFARDDGGQGWCGETNDQEITDVMFIVIAFFPVSSSSSR